MDIGMYTNVVGPNEFCTNILRTGTTWCGRTGLQAVRVAVRHGRTGLGQRVLFGELVEDAARSRLPGSRSVTASGRPRERSRGTGAAVASGRFGVAVKRRFRQQFLTVLERLVRGVDRSRRTSGRPRSAAELLHRLVRSWGRFRLLRFGRGPERSGHRWWRPSAPAGPCSGRPVGRRRPCRHRRAGRLRRLRGPSVVLVEVGYGGVLRGRLVSDGPVNRFLLSGRRGPLGGSRRREGFRFWVFVFRAQLDQRGCGDRDAFARRLESVLVGPVFDDSQFAHVVHVTVFSGHFARLRLGLDLERSVWSLEPVSVRSVLVVPANGVVC